MFYVTILTIDVVFKCVMRGSMNYSVNPSFNAVAYYFMSFDLQGIDIFKKGLIKIKYLIF